MKITKEMLMNYLMNAKGYNEGDAIKIVKLWQTMKFSINEEVILKFNQ